MGILLSKLPEQESTESSETTNHGSRNRSRSANRKRKTRDREADVPVKSRKKSKSSHDAGTFTHNVKSSHNDAISSSVAPVTSMKMDRRERNTVITDLESSTISTGQGIHGADDSCREKKSRRRKKRKKRCLENKADSQLNQPSSNVEMGKLEEQDHTSITPATPKARRRKRNAPSSPHFLESHATPEEKPSKKKSKVSIIETASMPASLPHFRPTSPDEFGLIQEKLRHDPWRMLVAVIFLNVTTAKMALPLLSQLLERWPTPEALSKGTQHQYFETNLANFEELSAFLYPIGLYNTRAKRLIDFSTMWLSNPPQQDVLTKRKGLSKYPPTAISHLPGVRPPTDLANRRWESMR